MADTGSIGHVSRLGGAALKLYGGVAEDQRSLRVYAGPREDQTTCGEVVAFSEGQRSGVLSATPDGAGVLSLRIPRRRGLTETVLLDAGTQEEPNGKLVLRPGSGPAAGIQALFEDGEPVLWVYSGLSAIAIRPGSVEVLGGAKNFVEPHPENPNLALYYCALEGPEAAAYARGTTRMKEGRAEVRLPEHFAAVTAPAGLTVQLTPRSPSSKGVCASALDLHHLVIEELQGGLGEYDVDWFIQGVRRGHEGYRVVRERRRPPEGSKIGPP